VYAHNILVNEATGAATLCDYGASFLYPPGQVDFEKLEVRAFGLFLKDLAVRVRRDAGTESKLLNLQVLIMRCLDPNVAVRPTFRDLGQWLSEISGLSEVPET
jgi:hypothetical protein